MSYNIFLTRICFCSQRVKHHKLLLRTGTSLNQQSGQLKAIRNRKGEPSEKDNGKNSEGSLLFEEMRKKGKAMKKRWMKHFHIDSTSVIELIVIAAIVVLIILLLRLKK